MDEELNNELLEMPFLRNVGFVMTYKCQVSCQHCIIEAGPHRTEEMFLDDAFDWIQQVANYKGGYIKVLSLTGGEPFYNLEVLKRISEYAEACGLFVSAVTNAFWASEKEVAINLLKDLRSIKFLSISTDVHHQKYIPFDWVKNAIMASKECDIPYTIAVCTENEEDPEYLKIIDELEEFTNKDRILTAITFPAGRALEKLDVLKYRISKEPPISACAAGSSPIVFPDGKVIACIGPVISISTPNPMMLGNLSADSLPNILDRADLNSILHAIRIWGPQCMSSEHLGQN